MNPPTTTASSQSTLEKVRELVAFQKKYPKLIPLKPWADCLVIMFREIGEREPVATHNALKEFVIKMFNSFPETASLVESQAKSITAFREALALAQSMIRGREEMSDASEKIFRDAFDSNPSHE